MSTFNQYTLSVYYTDGGINDFTYPATTQGLKRMATAAQVHMQHPKVDRVNIEKTIKS